MRTDKTARYREAIRYMDNAKEILSTKAKKQGDFYQDPKYVSMACGTAYSGVLIAVEEYLEQKGKRLPKKSNNHNVDDYRRALASIDKKMLHYFNATWLSLHCDGYYNKALYVKLIAPGFEAANHIINAIKPSKN